MPVPSYNTGTVTVTNGSATVTGSGTLWNTGSPPNVRAGESIQINNDTVAYLIAEVVSDTELTLDRVYAASPSPSTGLSYFVLQKITAVPGDSTGFREPQGPKGTSGLSQLDATVRTSAFTAQSGYVYRVDSSGSPGVFNITLPSSPAVDDVVDLYDYGHSWGTNNIEVLRNGSNIAGAAADLTLDLTDMHVRLRYMDATEGWAVGRLA